MLIRSIAALVVIGAIAAGCGPREPKTLSPAQPTVLDISAENGIAILARAESQPNGLAIKMADYANRCLPGVFAFPVKAVPYSEAKSNGQQDRGFFVYRTTEDGSLPEELINDGTADAPGKLLYAGVIAFNRNTTTIFEQGIGTLPGMPRTQQIFRGAWRMSSPYEGRVCP